MSIVMKALRSFRGEPGEGNIKGGDNRMVDEGGEFTVASERRAEVLERAGLAAPIAKIKQPAPASAKAASATTAENKAASAGPLPSVGGKTGGEPAPSLLDQDHRPPQRSSSSRGFGRGRGS